MGGVDECHAKGVRHETGSGINTLSIRHRRSGTHLLDEVHVEQLVEISGKIGSTEKSDYHV